MADRLRKGRFAHFHDISNLTYGHFGAPTYDKESEEWRFQRRAYRRDQTDDNGEEFNQPDAVPLRLILFRSGRSDGNDGDEQSQPTKASRYEARRMLKWFPEITSRSPVNVIRNIEDSEDNESSQHQSAISNQVVLAYASYASVRSNYHAEHSKEPLVVSVSDQEGGSLRLTPLRLQEVIVGGEMGMETQQKFPLLSVPNIWNSPLSEPILQICYSALHSLIIIRQISASTLCLPRVDDRRSQERAVSQPVISLPVDRTGGHPHADVTTVPWGGLSLGVVDTHGNWSIWQIYGKRALSARLLYHAKLLESGKLISWTEEKPPPKGSNPYFDGWHKICFLRRDDNTTVVLVMNRRNGVLYDTDGVELQSVEIQLPLESDWILDVFVDDPVAATCFILTSSSLILMRMKSTHGSRQSLQLECSWNHFLGRGDLSLKMRIMELPAAIHIFLYSQRSPQLTLFILQRGGGQGQWSLQDPIPFHLCSEIGLSFSKVTDLMFLPFEVPSKQPGHLNSSPVIKVILRMRNGQLAEALYKYTGDYQREVPRNASIHAWPHLHQQRVLSALVVDDEEDDVDEFVVDDDDQTLVAVVDRRDKLEDCQGGPTRNWPWVLNAVDQLSARVTIAEALDQAELHLHDDHGTHPTGLLRELVTEFRVEDVEEAESHLSAWVSHIPTVSPSGPGLALTELIHNQPLGLLHLHTDITSSFMEPLSHYVNNRVRVNTERLCRQVAMDVVLSSVAARPAGQNQAQQVDEDMQATTGGERPASSHDTIMTRLSKYTSFGTPPANLSISAISDLTAHLPDTIDADPDEYSYADVELGLARKRLETQQLDPAARRRAEKVDAARRRRAEKAKVTMKSTFSQETPVAVLSSSQDIEQRGMTQPERGDFGTRPLKTGRVGKKKKQKLPGFG